MHNSVRVALMVDTGPGRGPVGTMMLQPVVGLMLASYVRMCIETALGREVGGVYVSTS